MQENENPTPRPIQRNLFDYLSHLDNDKDFPAIKKYLQSPFFKVDSREKVIQLFDLLILHYPNYKGNPQIGIPKLNKKMKITYVSNLKRTLVVCIEDYLRIKRVRENEQWSVLLLAESLDKMNMFDLFNKYSEMELEKLAKLNALNEYDYHLKYQLLIRRYSILSAEKLVSSQILESAIEAMNYYYLHQNMSNVIGHQLLDKISQESNHISQTKIIINSFVNYTYIEDYNIKIAYHIFKYYELSASAIKEKIDTYLKIKKLAFENWKNLTNDYMQEVYYNMVNIANDIVLNGDILFEKELFEIHNFWTELNVHKTNGEINFTAFISIIFAACNADKIDWAVEFIESNKHLLRKGEEAKTLDYCYSYLHFCSEDYDKALSILLRMNSLNFWLELKRRILVLKCLFKKNSVNRLQIRSSNTKKFIRIHKKLSQDEKDDHLLLINTLNKIVKAIYSKDLETLNDIRKKINNEVKIAERTWLVKILKQ